ncbi:MAG TPA: PKD domain-containing protein, partial [Ktedonobacterales bacterium]|nr:PKD domain-containing protein [Ktedonobacterales bacterium]
MRKWISPALKIALGVLVGIGVSLSGIHIGPHGLSFEREQALACGIGPTATMLANNQPALKYPIPASLIGGNTSNLPQGVFALNYTINQPISFTEDLSKLPNRPDPNLYQWSWDFGDGGKGTGYTTTHTYTKAGDFKIVIGIVDPYDPQNNDPIFDSAQVHIAAQTFDQLPVAVAHGSGKYVQIGDSITYDATGSHSLVGGDLTYTWNFGDGTIATGAHVVHKFGGLGGTINSGNVTLIVKDQRGAISLATVPVVVALFLPTGNVSASATSVNQGATVTFDASKSAPIAAQQSDAIVSYQWNFGDGGNRTTQTPQVTYTYSQPGAYTVTVQAFDKNNLPGTASVTIHVLNTGPFGLGNRAPLVFGGIGIIAAIF